MKLPLAASSLLLTLALSACASLNPMHWFSGKKQVVAKPAPLLVIKNQINVATVWHTRLSDKKTAAFSPAAVLDAIYIASNRNELARINPQNGQRIWKIKTPANLSAGVGASLDSEFLGTQKGELIAYDAGGKQRWKTTLSSSIEGLPRAADGILVVRTGDGDIYGLDAATGVQKWRYRHTLPSLTLQSQAGVVLYKGGVFAGYAGGKLLALTLDTGSIGWDAEVSIPHGATEIERINDVTSNPVVNDHEACAVNFQGRLSCFDVHSGNQLWAKDMSSTSGLAMDDNNIYVSDTEGNVYAFESEHGVNLWKQSALHLRQLTAPCRVGDYLAVGDLQGYIHFLSLEDGHFVARIATDGSPILTAPVPYRNGLLVQTGKGGLYFISLS